MVSLPPPCISSDVLDQLPVFYQALALELARLGRLQILDARGVPCVYDS